jgi:hypothetical protein
VLLALSLFLTEKGGNHMIYNKLEGTTSKSFKLGKNGVIVESLDSGELKIVTKDYEFILGSDEVEGLLENGNQRTIASWQVVENYITTELENVVGDLTGVEEALQQISGIAGAINNDPDFYLHVLRLQDTAGNAVDGQIVKGTTTFEKNVTFGGKIIGPSTLTIDPLLVDTEDSENPNLGTVVIHGNLQIDGITTTINSQTVDIVDKNITLAVGSTNAAAADGAGISIEGAGVNFVYDDSDDSMNLNKNLNVDGELSVTGVITSDGKQVLTSVSGGTISAGEAITSAEIIDGELVFEKDGFMSLGTSSSSLVQDIYGKKTFKDEINADNGIVTTTLESTVADGTAPLSVLSTTLVTNLNADLLDGQDGSYYLDTSSGNQQKAGNLAIGSGTTQSDARLHILNNTNYGLLLENTSTSASIYNNLVFKNNSGKQYALSVGQSNETNLSVADKFYIFDVTNSMLRFVVNESGDIGIGTASPSEKLEVVGIVKATSFSSTVADGTAPLSVLSTTLVTNLNADKLDGADLETSLTNNSDEKVPTSKAVGDYAVPKQLSILQNSVSYDSSLETSQKNNSYIYIYDNSGESGVAKKISVSEIHRPSAYIQRNQAQVVTAVKAGDFIYEEI